MSPRPILKQRSVSTDYHHHHHHPQQYIHHPQLQHYHHPHHAVHFPPSPALTRTFSAHSSAAYDRSPIVVSPNTCALPERGCPGRTYLLDEQPKARGIAYARDYHPRALAFASSNANSNNAAAYAPVPPLVPDLSSESDESDGFYNIPGDADNASAQQSFGVHGLAGPSGASGSTTPKYSNSNGGYGYTDDPYAYAPDSDDADTNTLHFLPHGRPTSLPTSASAYGYMPSEGDIPSVHTSRRKTGSDRRHESSMDPDRIPSGGGSVDPSSLGFGSLAIGSASASARKRATSPSSIRKKGVRRTVQPMMMQLQQGGGFGAVDDGCLGGF